MHYSVEAASADKLDSFPILLDRVLDLLCGEGLLFCVLFYFLHMYILSDFGGSCQALSDKILRILPARIEPPASKGIAVHIPSLSIVADLSHSLTMGLPNKRGLACGLTHLGEVESESVNAAVLHCYIRHHWGVFVNHQMRFLKESFLM